MRKVIVIVIAFILGIGATILVSPEKSLEVVSLRTESSKTYDLGNGHYELSISSRILHYKEDYTNSEEQWKDIDLTWDGRYLNTAPYTLSVSNSAVSMKDRKTGDSIACSLQNGVTVIPFNEGVKLQRTYTSINQLITAPPIPLSLNITGSSIQVICQGTDANGNPLSVTGTISNGQLTETIAISGRSLKTMNGNEAVFPITVDPTYSILSPSKCNWIDKSATTTNYGADTNMYSGWSGSLGGSYIWRTLLEFDVDWTQMTGATIDSATLSLRILSVIGTATYYACKMLKSNWVEGSGGVNVASNWEHYTGTTDWTTAGCGSNGNDYTTTNQASTTVDTANVWANWDVLAQMITARDSTEALFRIDGVTSGTTPKQFEAASGEYGTAEYRPKLIFGYTLPISAPTIHTDDATPIEAATARLNGEITATGGEDPTVTVYWGDNDGETTPGNWDFSSAPTSPVQPQGVALFYKDVNSLSAGTLYYFSAKGTNSGGTGWGTTKSFTTKPAAPTNVAATDGTYTDKVVVTWTKSTGATGYKIYENGNLLDTVGDVATWDDTTAPSPTITAGNASASDGASTAYVTLSIASESVVDGTPRTYKVKAFNGSGNSADSNTDTGYRGVGALTYQWYRSAADSDADYSVLLGGTTNPYNDTSGAVAPGGRYYKCYLSATGAVSQYSTSDRRYKLALSAGYSFGYILGA